MYSYDWIVLVTLGLERWKQTRQTPPHRQATHEIEFEAAQQRHGDQLKAAKTSPGPARKNPNTAAVLMSQFRAFRSRGFTPKAPAPDLPKPQACLASGGDSCSSERAAS